MLFQKRSRPKKMKIIPWSLPLLRLGKSLPTTRTLKLEIFCFFCHSAASDKQRTWRRWRSFPKLKGSSFPWSGPGKGFNCVHEEELIPLDLGKTRICLLRKEENLQALKVSLLLKKWSSVLWCFGRDFSLLRLVLLSNRLSNITGFQHSEAGAGFGKWLCGSEVLLIIFVF